MPLTDRDDGRSTRLVVLFALSGLATLLLHAVYVRPYLPGEFVPALPFLLAGWAMFCLSFYALGRIRSEPAGVESVYGGRHQKRWVRR